MQTTRFSLASVRTLRVIFAATLLLSTIPTSAQEETVIYSFGATQLDGFLPAGLVFDAFGNLYGTCSSGGAYNNGAVFELTPQTGGGWKEKVLFSFCRGSHCAWSPNIPLTMDSSGNLYGTTSQGGAYYAGTAFELLPTADGNWTQTVLHEFGSSTADGILPSSGLIFDASGNLDGTTSIGGTYNTGTVFRLSPQGGGGWTETILHTFGYKDGERPYGDVIFDAAGNLYGTTAAGGYQGQGTVFELEPAAGGGWTEKILHSFNRGHGHDGTYPTYGVIFDTAGNLYGATTYGGAYGGTNGGGTVFELTRTAGGWTEKVLHSFGGMDGYQPYGGVIFDAAGNLYGTTAYGGKGGEKCNNGVGANGCGTLFELTPQPDGTWTETVLHFFGQGKDVSDPYGSLIFDASGNLYGTGGGGAYGWGAVFEFKP